MGQNLNIDTTKLAALAGLEPTYYFVKGNRYNHRSNYESDYHITEENDCSKILFI